MPRGIPNPKPQAAAAPAADAQDTQSIPAGGFTLPDALKPQRGAALLLEACNVFGVNPDMTAPVFDGRGRGKGPFRELLNWKFYPGDERAGIPDAVTITTAGGTKIKFYADPDFPMDADTESRLRNVFHCWRTNPQTKEVEPTPLPEDLTLSRTAVTGQPVATGHQFPGGYLRRKTT